MTQDLCAVCAVDVTTVDDALAHLGCTAEVLTVDPHTLDEVLDSVLLLGQGHRPTRRRRRAGRSRCGSGSPRSGARVAGRPRPRVAVLEWTDPPYAPGHWIPEMVELAGGESVLGAAGQKSIRDPLGRPARRPARRGGRGARAASTARVRRPRPTAGRATCCPPGVRVHAVDADGMWARPGPRLVDGVEELASVLHPS